MCKIHICIEDTEWKWWPDLPTQRMESACGTARWPSDGRRFLIVSGGWVHGMGTTSSTDMLDLQYIKWQRGGSGACTYKLLKHTL